MNHRTAFTASWLGLASALSCCSLSLLQGEEVVRQKPNIVLILADDLGIGNVGCYGADHFKTPHIDALAASGLRFERCFSAPVCGPSRAMIMTGRYGFRTGMTGNDKGSSGIVATSKEIMMPKVLKPAGYASCEVGKWSQLPLEPGDWGFDEYLRFQGSGTYWNTQERGESYTLNGKQVPLAKGEYLPDKMHAFAVDFITRNKDRPFLLYYPMSHVHSDILRTPDSAPDSKDYFTDNINYMDKLVGKLLGELDRLKLRDRTLVLFVGDNGSTAVEAERATIHGRRLSGNKGTMLEGGSLVPCIASWPGVVPAGKVSRDLIDFSDFLPTLAGLCGAQLPEGVTIDGKSFAPQLHGQSGSPREWAFVQLGRSWYVRDDQWKLNHAGELFDMKGAPFEEKPVAVDSADAASVDARKRLQAVLVKLDVKSGKIHHGDGTGKHEKNSTAKATGAAEPAPPADATDATREARFAKLDKNKTGKVTREIFMSRQSDQETGARRFDQWDVNKDGVLTREEFLHQGTVK